MPVRHHVPEEVRGRPFSLAREPWVLTPQQVRGRSYSRILRGAYWSAEGDVHHGVKVRAALAVLPPEVVVAGRSAMWFWGAKVAAAAEPVEVVLQPGHHVRNRPEVVVHRSVLRDDEWQEVPTCRVTTPARTAFDVGRSGDPLVTVPLLDALMAATGVTVEEISDLRRSRPGARGCRRLDEALTYVTGRAESPPESRLRVYVIRAGLPTPQANYSVVVDGVFLARVELAWPEVRVAVEYDGEYHDHPGQIAADRARLNRLKAAGWTVIVVDRHQMRRPDRVVQQIGSVLARASR